MPRKTKKKIKIKNGLLIPVLVLGGMIIGFGIFNFFIKSNDNTVEAGRNEPWYTAYTTCTLDPSSTDRTPPTVRITNPVDGDTVPAGDGTANIRITVIASDDQQFFAGGLRGNSKAWLLRNGEVRGIDEMDENGNLVSIINDTPFYFWDGLNFRGSGRKTAYQIGICDFAGNKAYSNTVTVTGVR